MLYKALQSSLYYAKQVPANATRLKREETHTEPPNMPLFFIIHRY
uniref:Putative Phd n=1 Tax=Bacillus thuringiensis serovar thuringiensis TaxID=1432 RepID=Q8GLD1_BACTU|nr:putative Phd [Bacillus thuringiensis serovar thuringiensis]